MALLKNTLHMIIKNNVMNKALFGVEKNMIKSNIFHPKERDKKISSGAFFL